MKWIIPAFAMVTLSGGLRAQTVIPLYAGPIPNAKDVPDKESSETYENRFLIISHVTRPTLTLFPAPAAISTGTAVIVIPGGGYQIVAAGHEGYDVAKELNKAGISAFVLKYRIPEDSTMVDKTTGPLQDAQRAIQLVREHAKEWRLDPARIGVMGFSAGGHLASTAGTHFRASLIENKNHVSLRPDFMILVYPVISFSDSIGHIGSRNNLLGKTPSAEAVRTYSNELQVSPQTPPSFLVHARDDDVVKVQNSIDFYESLKKNQVPAGIYLYDRGGHGFGLNNPTSDVKWISLAEDWMRKQDFLRSP